MHRVVPRSLLLFWVPSIALLAYGVVRVPFDDFLASKYPAFNEVVIEAGAIDAKAIREGKLDFEGAAASVEACTSALELANEYLGARLSYSTLTSIFLILSSAFILVERVLWSRDAAQQSDEVGR